MFLCKRVQKSKTFPTKSGGAIYISSVVITITTTLTAILSTEQFISVISLSFIFLMYFIELQLIYNVVLISAVN